MGLTGIAATLREAEPGTKVRVVLEDGREITGALRAVDGESVDIDEWRVDLRQVKRLNLEFSSAPRSKQQRKKAA
jgi:hypothetical protein